MTDVRQSNRKLKSKKRTGVWELGMTAPLIFLLLRIPLANILGNEGNGYLAVSWELYIMFTMLFFYGIAEAVYEMVRKRVQKNLYRNSIRVLSSSLGISLIVSLLGSVLIYLSSDFIYQNLYGIRVGGVSFKVFAGVLPISAIAGCLRGYFEGTGSKIPTHYSKIAEAVVAGSGALILGKISSDYGEKVANLLFDPSFQAGFGAAGVVLGFICGGILSVCFLAIIYKIYQISLHELLKKDDTRIFERFGGIIKELFYMIFITTLPILFFRIYRIVNITFYLNSLQQKEKLTGIRYVGSYHGKVILLVFLCVTLIVGFTSSGIGRVKRVYLQQKYILAKRYYFEEIKGVIIASVSLSLFLFIGSKYLMEFLFQSATDYEVIMLKIGAMGVLLISVATYNYHMLASLNKKLQILIVFFIAFIVQTVAILIMLRTSISDYGILIAELLFWAVTLILQLLCLGKTMKFLQKDV